MRRVGVLIAAGLLAGGAKAADSLPSALQGRMAALSASLETEGDGWAEYASILHPNYARWAIGESYQRRDEFVDGLKEWWDYGMRVKSRYVEIIAADLTGNVAIIRMKTSETFTGPDGDADGFDGYVINMWIREDGEWKLLSADIASATP